MTNVTRIFTPVLILFVSWFLFNEVIRRQRSQSASEASNIDVKDLVAKQHLQLKLSFFPSPLFEANGSESSESLSDSKLTTEHDPRLMPALWLALVHQQLRDGATGVFSVAFQWLSLVDLSAFLQGSGEYANCNPNNAKNCTQNETSLFNETVPWAVLSAINEPLSASDRAFVSASYLLHSKDFKPRLATLLGIGAGESSFLTVNVECVDLSNREAALVKLMEDFQKWHPNATEICLKEEIEKLKVLVAGRLANLCSNLYLKSLIRNDTLKANHTLAKEEFNFPLELATISHQEIDHFAPKDRMLVKNVLESTEFNTKYFNEAHLHNNPRGFHYDWRFYKKAKYTSFEQKAILHRTARAWLRFCRSTALTSWLAHGSLLGWYWNGMNFPWDEDIDVQMTAESLFDLARHYNHTVVVDYSDNENYSMAHLYFIDVNPHFMTRKDENRTNVIDARFIDTASGMYVDITGLTITSRPKGELNNTVVRTRLPHLINSDYSSLLNSASADPKSLLVLYDMLNDLEDRAVDQGNVVNCKNMHFYNIDDLSPLILTSLEGELAYIPRRFETILKREYKKGLIHKHYNSWSFRPYLGIWLPDHVCKGDYYGRNCDDEDSILESHFTRDVRLKKSEWFVNKKKITKGRIDPFILQRNSKLLRFSHTQWRT